MKHVGRAPSPAKLIQDGPVVRAVLAPHRNTPVQHAQRVCRMMVDTGASKTLVADHICQELGLNPIRFHPIVGISAKPEEYPVYLLSVGIGMSREPKFDHPAEQIIFFHTEIMGMPRSPDGLEGLLGRDFLVGFRFLYDGPTATFEIIDRRGVLDGTRPTTVTS